MARNSERWLQRLKVILISSWFGFACIWAVIWYLGFRLNGVVWEPGLMDVASGLNGLEVVGVIFVPPASLLAIGYLILNFLEQAERSKKSSLSKTDAFQS